jgi:4-alpha-glucanotransferase
MVVLQFALGGDPSNPHLPRNHETQSVVYTGTHDNDTTLGWFSGISEDERARVLRYLAGGSGRVAADLMRLALSSVARIAIVPLQDVLDLGSEARFNTPGAAEGNWAWRVQADQFDAARAECLAELTETYGRG